MGEFTPEWGLFSPKNACERPDWRLEVPLTPRANGDREATKPGHASRVGFANEHPLTHCGIARFVINSFGINRSQRKRAFPSDPEPAVTALLADKVLVITGAGGGLGRAYALAAAAEGALLVLNDLGCNATGQGPNPQVAHALAAEIGARGRAAIAHSESVATAAGARSLIDTALQRFGRIDGLINNAGTAADASLLETDEALWDRTLDVHLKGSFLTSRYAVEAMLDGAREGTIVNTLSLAGLLGNGGQLAYAAAKAGVYGLSRAMAAELANTGIRVNAIAPMAQTRLTAQTPMVSAALQAEQLTPLVVFLVSDLSRGVNGRTFGAHGSWFFEYRMDQSPGLAHDDWHPRQLGSELATIGFPPERSSATAAVSHEPKARLVRQLLANAAAAFRPRHARAWTSRLLLRIAGSAELGLVIEDGSLREAIVDPRSFAARVLIAMDTTSFVAQLEGSLEGSRAFLEGRLQTNEVLELLRYQRAFDWRRALREHEQVTGDSISREAAPLERERQSEG